MIEPGDLVKFDINEGPESTRVYEGTAMTEEINGLVLLVVHDSFVVAGHGWIFDKNVMPVLAVRVGSVKSFEKTNTPQGKKR